MDRQELFSPKALRLSWERYIRSTQRRAKDYAGWALFERDLEENLAGLSRRMIAGEFHPTRPAKFYMPKATGTQRTMTVLPIEDAIIYQGYADALATTVYSEHQRHESFVFGRVLHPEVEQGVAILAAESPQFYFFRPWEPLYAAFAASVNDALEESDPVFKFETDITGFFDSIPHFVLLEHLEGAGVAEQELEWLELALNVWSGTREGETPGVGIPQGPCASSFFGNMVLAPLDDQVASEGLRYYRYMDDIRIFAEDRRVLHRHLVEVDRWLKTRGLALNGKKTAVELVTEANRGEFLIDFTYGEEAVGAVEEPKVPYDSEVEPESEEQAPKRAGELVDAAKAAEFANEILEESLVRLRELSGRMQAEAGEKDLLGKGEKDLINLSAQQCRWAFELLEEQGLELPDFAGELAEYWISISRDPRCFWLMEQLAPALALFRADMRCQQALLDVVDVWPEYEWVQGQALKALRRMDPLSDRDLRGRVFPLIRAEDRPWYAKLEAHLLLGEQAHSAQLRASIDQAARKEGCVFLRRELALRASIWVDESALESTLQEFGLE